MSAVPSIRKAKIPHESAALAAPAGAGGAESARAGTAYCDHCGDSLAGLKIQRRNFGAGSKVFCCLGCAFIAEQIFLAEAGRRDCMSLGEPATAAAGLASATGRLRVDVQGMVCAACALLIEHTLQRLPGVAAAHVDFAAGQAHVAFDPQHVSARAIERAIQRAGYRTGGTDVGQAAAKARRTDLLRVLLAWLMMMQVMMLAVPAYLTAPGDIAPDIEQLLRIAQLVLTVPVLLFAATPFFRAASSQLRMRHIGMDVPIALGLSAAFAASAWATVRGAGPVYFDSVTMFVALVLGTRWLQSGWLARARRHVDAARQKTQLWAQRLRAFPASAAGDRVTAEALAAGDHVMVAPGETIPADGVVVQGVSTLSQAWLTGEATPIEAAAGSEVSAGSVNLEQPLVVQVQRAGDATSLAALRRLVDEAGSERPRVVELANRAAHVFLWAVVLITAATVAAWAWIDPTQALPNAIAVLVATCPCALSLAAPAAFTALQGALARHGILTVRVAALERLAHVDTLVCDKTGTLTLDAPVLARVVPLRGSAPHRWLAQAAALESLASHPFARALVAAAQEAAVRLPPVVDGEVTTAAGVEATIDGARVRIGRPDFALGLVEDDTGEAREIAARDLRRRIVKESRYDGTDSVVVLADALGPRALFFFDERPRTGGRVLMEQARVQGIDVAIVSGDRAGPVQRLAVLLGIDSQGHALACQTPESKRRFVAQRQAQGRTVAMLGDGINDAPVIAQADVAIALASGSSLAQTRADLIVIGSELGPVAAALRGARRAMRIVRQNLAWALVYNVVAIPLAALGYVTPAGAAVGMAASSALVLANAWRARKLD